MWEESDREALGVASLHTSTCDPTEAEGTRKAVRFPTVPSFPRSPGTHLCDDSHLKQGAYADQTKQGHLSGQISILLLMGNAISVWQSCGEKAEPRQLLKNLDLSTCFHELLLFWKGRLFLPGLLLLKRKVKRANLRLAQADINRIPESNWLHSEEE